MLAKHSLTGLAPGVLHGDITLLQKQKANQNEAFRAILQQQLDVFKFFKYDNVQHLFPTLLYY